MKSSTRNRAKGLAKEAKGRTKATAGEATRSARLRSEGRAEETRGRFQRKVGELQSDFEDTKDDER